MNNLVTPISSLNPDKIAFAGDWHGDVPYALKAISWAAKKHAQAIVHVGDFGLWRRIYTKYDRLTGSREPYGIGDYDSIQIWDKQNKFLSVPVGGKPPHQQRLGLLSINTELEKYGIDLIVIPGNHEDYIALYDFPVVEEDYNTHTVTTEWKNLNAPYHWGLRQLRSRIFTVPFGYTWVWNGVKFMGFGGAVSIDKEYRVPNITWFREETPQGDEFTYAEQQGKVDVLVTHDCPERGIYLTEPSFFSAHLLEEAASYRRRLDHLVICIEPETIIYGHHHENAQDNMVDGSRFLGLQDSGKPYNQNMRTGKLVNRKLVLDER